MGVIRKTESDTVEKTIKVTEQTTVAYYKCDRCGEEIRIKDNRGGRYFVSCDICDKCYCSECRSDMMSSIIGRETFGEFLRKFNQYVDAEDLRSSMPRDICNECYSKYKDKIWEISGLIDKGSDLLQQLLIEMGIIED